MADHDAVDAHMAGKKEFSQSHDPHAYDRYRSVSPAAPAPIR
ncbi:hypothetical protein ACFSOZ_22585 [Mesorhizobium newzealandense]|uniref:Uncharacterized protein n=1 Tax=Mesorhizobium newzealandense TaxID=1300302 RepID=A0ABW4UG52_9HYPH